MLGGVFCFNSDLLCGAVLNKPLQTVHALSQHLVTVTVRDAQIPFGTETTAGGAGQFALLDHARAEGERVHAELGDGGKHIKGTLGFEIGKAHLVQPRAYIVPTAAVQSQHSADVMGQRLNTGTLDEGGNRHHVILVHLFQLGFHRRVRQQIAHTPAGHGVRLGKALNFDDAVTHV